MPAVLNLLRIKNLALVEDLEWQLEPGFTAITGETGAGKSIIIGALQLLLGERADKSLIRTGAEQCTVEAVFSGEDLAKLNAQLEEAGVEAGHDELILKRSFTAAGGNRQFINGSPTTLAVLKNLGDELVDLHGPHDHQSLLSPEKQLALLDAFAHAGEAANEYRARFAQLQKLRAEHAALDTAETAREQELALLRHQVGEITAANLIPGEEEEIAARYKLASSSQRLLELASAITRRLSEAEDSRSRPIVRVAASPAGAGKNRSRDGGIFRRARGQRGRALGDRAFALPLRRTRRPRSRATGRARRTRLPLRNPQAQIRRIDPGSNCFWRKRGGAHAQN